MTFRKDSNYYHTFVEFELRMETLKAYLIHIKNVDVWVPKKLCKEFTGTSAYIYTDILEKNIAKAKNKKLISKKAIQADPNSPFAVLEKLL